MILFIGIFFCLLPVAGVWVVSGSQIHRRFQLKEKVKPLKRQQLLERAQQLAKEHRCTHASLHLGSVKRHAKKNVRLLRHTYLDYCELAEASGEMEEEQQWLLDNFYVADELIKRQLRNLRGGSIPDFPTLVDGPYRGVPRIYAIAVEFVGCTGGQVEDGLLRDFIAAYQTVCYLTDQELWLLSTMLELALTEYLIAAYKETDIQDIPVGNLFHGMRSLERMHFTQLFEDLSQIEAILKEDPAQVYSTMDTATRQQYRQQVQRISRVRNMDAVDVAREALRCARRETAEKQHIGFALFQGPLCQCLETKKKRKQRLYFLLSSGITVACCALIGEACYVHWGSWLRAAAVAALALLPVWDAVLHVVNYWFAKSTSVTIIPRLKATDQVTGGHPTLVVISTLLTDEKQVEELIHKLELYYLANPNSGLSFGLLSDYKDAKEQALTEDAVLIDAARQGIDRLNDTYGSRFFLFHRKRTLHSDDQIYRGWERKRGAIVELVRFLKAGEMGSFQAIYGPKDNLKQVEYVITLDGDTRLLMESAGALVGAMAHPLNQPIIKNGRVTAGYGMLQPRMDVDIQSANRSLFAKIFAGQGGLDAYSGAVSDIYQDLFGEGIFTGKGIFRVDTFYQLLQNSIPENTVLSHDLLEGSYLRCGLMSDVSFMDGFPHKYSSYAMRLHRWIRGDWQLLPWLLGTVEDGQGNRVGNPLNALSKWKIFDNLRRSVTPVGLLIVVLAFPLILPKGGWVGGLLALIALGTSLLTASVDWVVEGQFRYWQGRSKGIIGGMKGALLQFFFALAFLPHTAWITIDAMVRAVYRMAVSHKKMLEWVTAADAEKQGKGGVLACYKTMWLCPVAALLLLAVQPVALWSVGICALWLTAPAVASIVSGIAERRKRELSKEDKGFLEDLAKRIWNYFSHFTLAEEHYLVPDNVQEEPSNGLAPRTSPTNMGIQLAAYLTAYDFGFVSQAQMLELMEQTIGVMEGLPKWKGHFYNWYHTTTLEILQPDYISTVDSGNLIAFFITVKQGLLELKDERAHRLAQRMGRLIDQTDFSALYDQGNNLFYTGYHVGAGEHTQTHYDLLASECRLASYVAVARGEVPKKHWFSLGRAMVARNGARGLVSWTGTMFEYYMPLLLIKNIKHTLLDETYQFVLQCQKAYGRQRKVPWGTSESGYFAFDGDLNYQYKAFGVPDLGLQRGLKDHSVVAPYATILGLMTDPKGAIKNMRRLKQLNAFGMYGFYEAVDFTPSRIPPGTSKGIVKSYMVHHLGMSLLSISNVLHHNILQRRFHSCKQMEAAEEILEERIPVRVVLTKDKREPIRAFAKQEEAKEEFRLSLTQPDPGAPYAQLLCGNRYKVMVTDSGVGYSKYRDNYVTRFRPDLYQGVYGNFVYIRNRDSGDWWTNTLAPAFRQSECYETTFRSNSAQFVRRGPEGIDTVTEVAVAPSDDVELRKLTITNRTQQEVCLEVTTYCEVILTALNNDIAHPAFSSLFIETEYDEETNCLYATRRPREAGKSHRSAIQTVCSFGQPLTDLCWETDRRIWLGRNRDVTRPAAMEPDYPLKGRGGAVIDPVFSLRFCVRLKAGESTSFALITAYGEHKKKLAALCRKYQDANQVEAGFQGAQVRGSLECNYLELNHALQKKSCQLLPELYYITGRRRRLAEHIQANRMGQQELWSLGLSGDLPIVTVLIAKEEDLEQLDHMIRLHHLWSRKGQQVDLAIVCTDEHSYDNPVMRAIRDRVEHSHLKTCLNVNGGAFIIEGAECQPELLNLLQAASRIVVGGTPPQAQEQGEERFERSQFCLPQPHKLHTGTLEFYNGYGGFDGMEYVIHLTNGLHTPLPWCNVVANSNFGFVASDSGTVFLWQGNSHENRLTPWSNDPVADTPQECVYLQDREESTVWSTTPAPIRTQSDYVTRFGFGYCRYQTVCGGIESVHTMFVHSQRPVKYNVIELVNTTNRVRTITLTYYANPLLGDVAQKSAPFLQTEWQTPFLCVKNYYRPENKEQTLYATLSEPIQCYTGDKTAFFGRARGGQIPDGLGWEALTNRTGSGMDGCICLQCSVTLQPNQRKTVTALLSTTNQVSADPVACNQALEEAKGYWHQLLTSVQVTTPDPSFNLLMNGWLLYQTVVCRLMGRSAFYQSGGAFGYRDQLQDVLAALHCRPDIAKQHIMRCCAHQFLEGDVQHWWHQTQDDEPLRANAGIRTRFSDDYLWLPYVVSRYVEATGDADLLEQTAPYLEGEPLKEEEDERYFTPVLSAVEETVYQHCIRAIENGLKFGAHGLPLMGSGDWNDGMNTVGNKGKGESVWMAWFLYHVLTSFAPICQQMGDIQRGERYIKEAETLKQNANQNGWDGEWYRRAYFDDGKVLGSKTNTECRIDGISQSWAVISGGGIPQYREQAVEAALEHLVDQSSGIIKLLTPPFDQGDLEPGYIKGYVPGVRENGGQYTHGAAWLIMACSMLGRQDKAMELFSMINPINHAKSPHQAEIYQVEPYVVAADVYSKPPNTGRGGWTWYTGSSGWMYQIGLQFLLGLKKRGSRLYCNPQLPAGWKEYQIHYRYGAAMYHIRITQNNPMEIELVDDGGEHVVEL